MKNGTIVLAAAFAAALASGSPARAWWFEDDGRSWPVFAFHEYDGSDVSRPGATPDRPYWHGDDAVPLGLRWRDLDAARAAEAAVGARVEAGAAIEVRPAPRIPHRPRRRLATRHRGPAPVCVPAPVAAR